MQYTYTKIVNSTQLENEIKASTITIAVNHIDTTETQVIIFFKTTLSNDELTILTGLVNAHVPQVIFETQNIRITEDDTTLKDISGKSITKDQPFDGPLYIPTCRFTTGKGDSDPSWKPPDYESSFWSIDVSQSGYTKINFMPTYNVQIDGTSIQLLQTNPTNELVLHKLILAPDIPVQSGGSYVFASNYQLVGDYSKYERYTAPKTLVYYSQIPVANKIQFIFKHDTNEFIKIQVSLSLYKI